MKRFNFFLTLGLVLIMAVPAFADGFFVSTDMSTYNGTLTKYGSLDDAQKQQNSIGGPYTIPDRVTGAPYNTGNRDLGLYFAKNWGGENANILLTSWWYTTDLNHGQYSGWGNPNNTNTGFIQLYDADGSTSTASSGSFGNFNGTNYTTFHLQVSGQNAASDDYARLWQAPGVGGAAGLTRGIFHSYSLDIVFGGLEGTVEAGGVIRAIDHPDSVSGTFSAIFQNTNTLDSQYLGFYRVAFNIGMDNNWAYGQGGLLNGSFSRSEFATPLPGAVVLLGAGLVRLARYGRRKKALI
jgi:hypothetical protein